jgi:hypothetical protein
LRRRGDIEVTTLLSADVKFRGRSSREYVVSGFSRT